MGNIQERLPAMKTLMEIDGILPDNHLLLPPFLRLLHHGDQTLTGMAASFEEEESRDVDDARSLIYVHNEPKG